MAKGKTTTAPKMGMHDAGRFTTFTSLVSPLIPKGGAMQVSGKWAVFPCTKRWAEANESGEIAAVKAAGFKTFWCRGNKMGARLDDVGLAAKV
jgi:hypothetical protein